MLPTDWDVLSHHYLVENVDVAKTLLKVQIFLETASCWYLMDNSRSEAVVVESDMFGLPSP